MKVMLNGQKIEFDVCVNMMDDEITEELHADMAPCGEQEFLDAYMDRHFDKFGEKFVI